MIDELPSERIPQAKRRWRPRLSEEITEEQYLKLQRLVPHGLRKELIGKLLDTLIDILECADADITTALILQGKIYLTFKIKEVDSESV